MCPLLYTNTNTLFVKKKVCPSKCIMLIRSDILTKLNKTSTNLNKVLVDNTVELYSIIRMRDILRNIY